MNDTHFILIVRDGEAIRTDEHSLMEELMEGWDGVGLPDKDYADKHPVGDVVNGHLRYAPEEVGGYQFEYTDEDIDEDFYAKLTKLEDDDEADIKEFVRDHYLMEYLNDMEFAALMALYS